MLPAPVTDGGATEDAFGAGVGGMATRGAKARGILKGGGVGLVETTA
jgi:hypothetical protein